MFSSLLIANRGEIACRIIKTAKRMGIKTIAVYSEADRDALHVSLADEAVAIGPSAARDSYLSVDRILDAARKTRAEAIHPGYGFLSETEDLVTGCEENGLVWVGPHKTAIASMGSKIKAKAIAIDAQVPCIPGYAGSDQTLATLVDHANSIGLPVMVKASAGGGGKGIRAVFDANKLEAAIANASQEAERSFGDGRLLIEKLIESPRHIEVQIIGDKHGNLIHVFDRDCSVQRNHQKLIEEAPAPNLDDNTRSQMQKAALMLARSIGYDSCGTVEFILDADSEEFYFLEMNTRLQVEHTVTEEISGLDLVELQLRCAAGEQLPIQQEQITLSGHAIEARLTAEDPGQDFAPQTGTMLHWQPADGLRVDTGIVSGSSISSHYDSMIAKLIATGEDRASAIAHLIRGLEATKSAGFSTNRLFLRDILASKRFQDQSVTTKFLSEEWPNGWNPPKEDGLYLAALAHHLKPQKANNPWNSIGSFRIGQSAGLCATSHYLSKSQPDRRITIEDRAPYYCIETDGKVLKLKAERLADDSIRIEQDGIDRFISTLSHEGGIHLLGNNLEGMHTILPVCDYDASQEHQSAKSPDRVTAPMPGLIIDVSVQEGQSVSKGDTLIVMESMKLLTELTAEESGTIDKITISAGDSIDAGELLVTLILVEEAAA